MAEVPPTEAGRGRWARWWPVLLLFVVALLPRVYHVGQYLPDAFHPDEDKEIRRAIDLAQGNHDLHRVHKGTLFTVLTVEYGVYYLALRATGIVDGTEAFGRHFARDPSLFFLLSRLTVALMGALGVLLAFDVGRRLGGRPAGVLAALMLTLYASHLELSRIGRLDVPLCFGVLMVVDLSLVMLARPTWGRGLALAAATAFTVSTKTSGAPFLLFAVPPVVGWLRSARGIGARVGRFGAAFGIAVVVVAILNFALLAAVAQGGVNLEADSEDVDRQYTSAPPEKWQEYIANPAGQLGIPVLLAALAGLVLLWRSGAAGARSFAVLVPVSVGGQILLLWMSNLASWRYVLPGQVLIVVLAGIGGALLADRVTSQPTRRIVLGVIGALLIVPGLFGRWGTLQTLERDLSKPSTVAAREWIEENLPSGSGFALEGLNFFPSQYMPRLPHSHASLLDRIEWAEATADPGLRGKADKLRRFYLPVAPKNAGYRILLYGYGKDRDDITRQWLRERKHPVRYVVLHDVKTVEGTEYHDRVRSLIDLCETGGAKKIATFEPAALHDRRVDIYDLGP